MMQESGPAPLPAGGAPGSRLWLKLALALGTVLACLVGLEVLARVEVARRNRTLIDAALHGRPTPPPGSVVSLGDSVVPSSNDRIAFELRPGLQDVVFRGQPLTTNSFGFRSGEIPVEEPEGAVTIVGIGDSIQFGYGVRREESYLERMATAIRAAHPGASWRLVNTAVPGYNTVMEVETLERKALRFSPDIVIVGVCGNDYAPPQYVREAIDPWRLDRCFLIHAARTRLGRLAEERADGPDEVPIQAIVRRQQGDSVPDRYSQLHGSEAYRGAVERLKELSEEHGFRLLAFAINDYPEAPEMMDVFREFGVETLHLQPGLVRDLESRTGRPFSWQDYADSDLIVGGGNTHPSVRQHGMAAELVTSKLTELGWLEELAGDAR